MKKQERDQLRDQIEFIRSRLHETLYAGGPIPANVVNGSIETVRDFKAACEALRDKYHIQHQPGKRHTGSTLPGVKKKLEGYATRLGLNV